MTGMLKRKTTKKNKNTQKWSEKEITKKEKWKEEVQHCKRVGNSEMTRFDILPVPRRHQPVVTTPTSSPNSHVDMQM